MCSLPELAGARQTSGPPAVRPSTGAPVDERSAGYRSAKPAELSNLIPTRNSAAANLPDFGRRTQESRLISPNHLENGSHLPPYRVPLLEKLASHTHLSADNSKILQFIAKCLPFRVSDLFPDFSENKSVKRSVIWQPKCKILSGFRPEVQDPDPRETPPLGLKWR